MFFRSAFWSTCRWGGGYSPTAPSWLRYWCDQSFCPTYKGGPCRIFAYYYMLIILSWRPKGGAMAQLPPTKYAPVHNLPCNSIDKTCQPFITKFLDLIICGDFNAHHKMWDSTSTSNQNGVSLFDFIEENDYSLQNTFKPTHMVFNAGLKCSLIDLIITYLSNSRSGELLLVNDWSGNLNRKFSVRKMS